MLRFLSIRRLAVIDSVEVEFGPPSAAVREVLGITDTDLDTADLDTVDDDLDDLDSSDNPANPDNEPDQPDEPGDELTDGTTGEQLSDQEAHR